jgi:hypothetical protein
MGREIPSFLKDFLQMRQNLHKQAPPQIVSAIGGGGEGKKTRTPKSTSDGHSTDMMEISVAKIIEEKPPKKEVMAYFQKECDRMTNEKMK